MRIARILFAALIAASVATLPMSNSVLAAPQGDLSASMHQSDETAMSMEMTDCCPHQTAPCDKTGASCTSMAACASAVVAFPALSFARVNVPLVPAKEPFLAASETISSQTGSPPFRPPRV